MKRRRKRCEAQEKALADLTGYGTGVLRVTHVGKTTHIPLTEFYGYESDGDL